MLSPPKAKKNLFRKRNRFQHNTTTQTFACAPQLAPVKVSVDRTICPIMGYDRTGRSSDWGLWAALPSHTLVQWHHKAAKPTQRRLRGGFSPHFPFHPGTKQPGTPVGIYIFIRHISMLWQKCKVFSIRSQQIIISKTFKSWETNNLLLK